MSEPQLGIIVLAAGASTRMGQAKQLLQFGGETFLRRAVNVALNSRCHPVVAVLGSDAERMRNEIADLNARVAINPDWAEGMASSIRCGILELEDATAGEVQGAILMLCDQPFVTSEIITQLSENYRKDASPIVASVYETDGESVYGVPAFFHRTFFPELLSLRGAEGARRIISRHQSQASFLQIPEAAFDVDTPDDYTALRLS